MKKINLNKNIKHSQKEKLVSILNSLEFKDDIVNSGGEIYAVGGIVRDAVMEAGGDDLDIVIRGIPYENLFIILSKYGKATDTSHIDENGKKDFGSTKFISNNKDFNQFLETNGVVLDIDIMLPRKDMKDPGIKGHRGIKSDVNPMYTIHDDLDRRDITINAIAMNLKGELIVNGTALDDIKNGIIKAVNKDAFIEDPLRMLRAIRFAARYDYNWDPTTIDIIKNNVNLLSDKEELPKERFLKEFKKMIGKSDLSRAVKTIVDFGVYKAIFGIESKISDYTIFNKCHNVGEMAFLMFENVSLDRILGLIEKNITNDTYILDYARTLIEYEKNKNLVHTEVDQNLLMARLYKISRDAVLYSCIIAPEFNLIAKKFENGTLPKDDHDLDFKGSEFKEFIINKISEINGDYIPSKDGIKMGKAKSLVLFNIFDNKLKNNKESIKEFLSINLENWLK